MPAQSGQPRIPGQPVQLNGRAGYLVLVRAPGQDLRPGQDERLPGPLRQPAEVIVDAELGVLLRLEIECGGRAASRFERQVTSGPPRDPAEFRVPVPVGLPTVADTGRFLDEVNAPPALQAAASAAIRALLVPVRRVPPPRAGGAAGANRRRAANRLSRLLSPRPPRPGDG
jgi:hypothetical protein